MDKLVCPRLCFLNHKSLTEVIPSSSCHIAHYSHSSLASSFVIVSTMVSSSALTSIDDRSATLSAST